MLGHDQRTCQAENAALKTNEVSFTTSDLTEFPGKHAQKCQKCVHGKCNENTCDCDSGWEGEFWSVSMQIFQLFINF